MKTKLSFITLIFLLSCAPTTSSLVSSLPSQSTSSQTTSVSITSNVSETTSSSITTSLSESVSSASEVVTSQSPSLASIWQSPMAIVDSSLFYSQSQPLTNDLSQFKVTQVASIYRSDQTFYGTAYEALVDGNGGPNSVRFRIGFVDGKFAALTMVSHREHGGFGLKIIQALLIQLPNKPATMNTVVTILINANANRTGITETYDGMIPAIEAMVIHYTAQIQ